MFTFGGTVKVTVTVGAKVMVIFMAKVGDKVMVMVTVGAKVTLGGAFTVGGSSMNASMVSAGDWVIYGS
jgi:hypothetical protein